MVSVVSGLLWGVFVRKMPLVWDAGLFILFC